MVIVSSAVEIDVFEFEEDYSSWSVRYHVNLTALVLSLIEEYGVSYKFFRVLSVKRAEKEEESELLFRMSGILFSFNFSAGAYKKIVRLVQCELKELQNVIGMTYGIMSIPIYRLSAPFEQ